MRIIKCSADSRSAERYCQREISRKVMEARLSVRFSSEITEMSSRSNSSGVACLLFCLRCSIGASTSSNRANGPGTRVLPVRHDGRERSSIARSARCFRLSLDVSSEPENLVGYALLATSGDLRLNATGWFRGCSKL